MSYLNKDFRNSLKDSAITEMATQDLLETERLLNKSVSNSLREVEEGMAKIVARELAAVKAYAEG